MALFDGDGPAFLTESHCNTLSHDEEEEVSSLGLRKKTPSFTSKKTQGGLGFGLFDDGEGEEEEEERGELFESTAW